MDTQQQQLETGARAAATLYDLRRGLLLPALGPAGWDKDKDNGRRILDAAMRTGVMPPELRRLARLAAQKHPGQWPHEKDARRKFMVSELERVRVPGTIDKLGEAGNWLSALSKAEGNLDTNKAAQQAIAATCGLLSAIPVAGPFAVAACAASQALILGILIPEAKNDISQARADALELIAGA